MAKANYGGAYRKDGDNTKYLNFLADMMLLPKIDLYTCTPEDVDEHIKRYLEVTANHDQRVSFANFALSLKISVAQLHNHINKKTRVSDAVHDRLMLIYSLLTASLEDGMISGSANTVASIFLAKNNFGYKDQTEQLIIHDDRKLTAEELKALAESLPEVVDADYYLVNDHKEITDKGVDAEDGKEEQQDS